MIQKNCFSRNSVSSTNYGSIFFWFSPIWDRAAGFFMSRLFIIHIYIWKQKMKSASGLLLFWLELEDYLRICLLAYIIIFGLIVLVTGKNGKKDNFKGTLYRTFGFYTILIINIYAFFNYHYTYLNWFVTSTTVTYPVVTYSTRIY